MAYFVKLGLITITILLAFGGLQAHTDNITFSLFATSFENCDYVTDCDLSVTIYCSNFSSPLEKCGETESITDENSPVWPEIFTFEHDPGIGQLWTFEVIDHDYDYNDLMATFEVQVDSYADTPGNLYQLQVPDENSSATLWLHRRR